jgi:chromosome partitioning protein
MRIISVINQKGGCGKTTTAVNLSACLAQNKKKVLLIDIDPQAHATYGLNINAEQSIYDVLSKLTHRKAKLEDIIKKVDTNFDIAPSSIILSTLEQELAGEIGRESRLWDVFNNFNGGYDYILIDCPPNLGILTINAIRAAQSIIIPVEASRFSLEGLSQLNEIMKLVAERLDHHVDFKVLVVNFDSRLMHSFKMLDEIKAGFKEKMFDTIVHVNVRIKEAQHQGTHILKYDKYCRGAKDYFSLSREIITIDNKKMGITFEEPAEIPAIRSEETPDAGIMPMLKEQMDKKIREELPKLSEIMFSLSAPEAADVYIAGEFNNWKTDDDSRMVKEDNVWTKRVNLAPGAYRYRFVMDGNWVEDPGNPRKEKNPFGQLDSLLEISN